MTASQLRAKYLEVFGEPARTGNKTFLYKRVAWRMQRLAQALPQVLAAARTHAYRPTTKRPAIETRLVNHGGDGSARLVSQRVVLQRVPVRPL